MKKIVASVGLVALGASALQSSATAQSLTSPEGSKPWSVSATLRGFYDDNVATIPNDQPLGPGQHRDVFGYEISPSASLQWALQQTTINLGVLYSFKHYSHTPVGSTDASDQTFTFNGDITHSFSDQLKVRVADGFVIGQEPDTLRAGNAFSTFQRISGDNIRNYGTVSLDAQLSPAFGISVGYDNGLYDYKAKGAGLAGSGYFYDITSPFFGEEIPGVVGSPSGVLDRIENKPHIEGLWSIAPETKLILGYAFTAVGYTADEYVGGFLIDPSGGVNAGNLVNPVRSNSRNYHEHIVYIGAQHNFSPQMTGSIRAGASYTDYYNSEQDASYTPYATADLKYTYAPESYVDFGFSYDRNATDIIGLLGNGDFTVDSQAAVVFANINHRIMPQFFGSLMAQFQNNIYNGGLYNNDTEQYYLVGLDFEYRFNQYFSGHVGYNYDRLESPDIGRTFDRNRVYIGVTASY